jgi:hypothetical protein
MSLFLAVMGPGITAVVDDDAGVAGYSLAGRSSGTNSSGCWSRNGRADGGAGMGVTQGAITGAARIHRERFGFATLFAMVTYR